MMEDLLEWLMWMAMGAGCFAIGWIHCHFMWKRVIDQVLKDKIIPLSLSKAELEELRIALERWHERQRVVHGEWCARQEGSGREESKS